MSIYALIHLGTSYNLFFGSCLGSHFARLWASWGECPGYPASLSPNWKPVVQPLELWSICLPGLMSPWDSSATSLLWDHQEMSFPLCFLFSSKNDSFVTLMQVLAFVSLPLDSPHWTVLPFWKLEILGKATVYVIWWSSCKNKCNSLSLFLLFASNVD